MKFYAVLSHFATCCDLHVKKCSATALNDVTKIVSFLGCGPGRKLDHKMAALVLNVASKWGIKFLRLTGALHSFKYIF